MAFDATKLTLIGHGPNRVYLQDAGDDSMEDVLTSGYINNADDNVNFRADDVILSICSDGNVWHRVSEVAAGGDVTSQLLSGDGPYNSSPSGCDTASGHSTLKVGVYEMAGAASAWVLPTPYPGAKVTVIKTSTATAGQTIVTNSTGVTLNPAGDRTITVDSEGQWISLLGVSATRWVVTGHSGAAFS